MSDFDPLTGGSPCALDETKRCLPSCDHGLVGPPCIRQNKAAFRVERAHLATMLLIQRRRIDELERTLELARREEEVLAELVEEST